MDIIFATNNNFCRHAAVAMTTLLNFNKDERIIIHLFLIDVDKCNIDKINKTLLQFENVELKVYNISDALFKDFPNPGYYSFATYLRLLTPSLLPDVSKVLYLDCDLIVNGSLQELWNTDIKDYSCAAVYDSILSYNIVKDYINYDYYQEGYANAGVLLMNLDYWRKHAIQDKLMSYLSTHKVNLNDQDAINIVLHGTIKFIHPKWNTQSGSFAFPPLVREDQKKYIKYLWNGARIVHFTGPVKPWHRECVHPYKHVYNSFKRLTFWNDNPSILLEKKFIKRTEIILLRYCKNFVAKCFSYCYR